MPFMSRSKQPTASDDTTIGRCDESDLAALRGEHEAIRRSQAVIEFTPDGVILTANDIFLAATGYTLDEIQGRHHRIFMDPEEAASPAYSEFWAKLGRGEFVTGEFRRVAKGGKEIWIQASYNAVLDHEGRTTRIVKYANDITEQKLQTAAHQAQTDAISRSQAVIEFALDGTILHANENFLAVTGYRLEEIQGRHHRIFCDDADAQSAEYAEFWKRLGAGEQFNGEFERRTKNGSPIWIQASYFCIRDASGRPLRTMKIASDITERVRTRQRASEVGANVASVVTEMAAAIDAIANNVGRTAALARDAQEIADETGVRASSLGESSRKIGDVVTVIQELADQTNLLALNATIEAARAGESGKSFAVVASEVKELANATAKATMDIEKSVTEIQKSIESVVSSTERFTTGIREVSENTTSVATVIEQQSVTMASLGESATTLRQLTVSA